LEVNGIIFNLGAAKLQIAMTGSFASELLQASSTDGGDNDRGMTDGAIEMLHASFSETTKRALASFTAASTDLLQLRRALDRLKASARSLRSVYVTGKIEMANLESSQLKSIFSDLGSHLRNAEANLQGLDEQIDTLQAQLQKTVRDAEGIDALIADADKSLLGAAAL
jgi:chromosome segregation ATPase